MEINFISPLLYEIPLIPSKWWKIPLLLSPPPSSFSRSGLSRTSGNSRAPLWCLWAAEFAGSYAEWNITVALFELPTNPPPGYTLTRDYLSLSIGLLRCEPRRRSSRFSKKFVSPYFCLPLFVCFFSFSVEGGTTARSDDLRIFFKHYIWTWEKFSNLSVQVCKRVE